MEVYGEMGWDYVCDLSPKMDVYRAQSPDAPELNSDEEILRRQLEKQTKGYIISAAASVSLMLAILIKDASLWMDALRRGFYETLLDRKMLGLAAVLVMFVVVFVLCAYTALRALRARKRQLTCRQGHTKEAARRGVRLQASYAASMALILLLCLCGFVDRQEELIDETEFPAPLVAAVSASEGEAWAAGEAATLWRTSFLFRRRGLLCMCYSARQNSPSVPYERRLDDGTVETMDVSLYYYDADVADCAWEWLARGYAGESAQRSGAQPIAVDGADEAWFIRKTTNSWADAGVEGMPDEDTQCLIVRTGCRVILVYYTGVGDLLSHADAYVQ